MKIIQKLQGHRWFIWTIVFIVVSLVSLATYIYYDSEIDNIKSIDVLVNHVQKILPVSYFTKIQDEDHPEGCYSLQNKYPEFRSNLDKKTEEDLNLVVKNYLEDMQGYIEGYGKLSLGSSYCDNIGVDIQYTTPLINDRVISFEFVGYIMLGGAHGSDELHVINYDMKKHALISIKDLFKSNSNYLSVLSLKVKQEMIDYYNNSGETDPADIMDSINSYTSPKPGNFENFTLTKNTLHFDYPRELIEVSHVAPPPEIDIPYGDLKDVFDPDGPIGEDQTKEVSWQGKWVSGDFHTQSHLTIFKVTDKTFNFIIEAQLGGNSGEIQGTASIIKPQILATADVKADEEIYGKKVVCHLNFHKKDNIINIDQTNDCSNGGFSGVGVGFDGEYKKGLVISEPTVLSLGVLETEEQRNAFVKLTGKYLSLFTESNMIEEKLTDDDGFSANVSSGAVMHIGGFGNIIMVTNDAKIWAAVADYDDSKRESIIRYFTNVKKYKKELPETIQNWASNMFGAAHIIYES